MSLFIHVGKEINICQMLFHIWLNSKFFLRGNFTTNPAVINMICNGQFMQKSPEETLDFFDELAKNNQVWDFSHSADRSRHSLGPSTSENIDGTR